MPTESKTSSSYLRSGRAILGSDQVDARAGQGLVDYARTPVTVTPLKSEPLLRLLICDLVGEEVTRESLSSLRDDIADLRGRLDDSEQTAEELPHREKYLLLVIDFLRDLLELHERLVDEVERVFPAPRQKRSRPAGPDARRTRPGTP